MWVRKLHQLAADGIIPNYPRLARAGETPVVAEAAVTIMHSELN